MKEVEFEGQVVSASSTITGPEVFTDDRGLTHLHDPHVIVLVYRCAMDHEWSKKEHRPCWCGWSAA